MTTFASTIGPALSNSFFKSSLLTSKNRFPTYTVLAVSPLGALLPASDVWDPNPAAAPRLCAAPVATSPAVCTADLTELAVEEAASVAFSLADSTLDVAVLCSASLAGVGSFAEAAIELSPCWASVAPSASGSDCVAVSSAYCLRWRGKEAVLGLGLRRVGYVRRVIDRALHLGAEMDTEGEEESTRSAVRRRQSLEQKR